MCLGCVRKDVDVTEGLVKQIILPWCRSCERYLSASGQQWVVAAPESRELLGICLKKCKLGGHTSVKLVDGGFLWTEPHSKRLKVKVTVQKEVFANTVLQQTYVVEVMLSHQQCGDCEKIMAKNTWKAIVQVRQKVHHVTSGALF
jgi:nonsense-mediated mRNA decay protein 3